MPRGKNAPSTIASGPTVALWRVTVGTSASGPSPHAGHSSYGLHSATIARAGTRRRHARSLGSQPVALRQRRDQTRFARTYDRSRDRRRGTCDKDAAAEPHSRSHRRQDQARFARTFDRSRDDVAHVIRMPPLNRTRGAIVGRTRRDSRGAHRGGERHALELAARRERDRRREEAARRRRGEQREDRRAARRLAEQRHARRVAAERGSVALDPLEREHLESARQRRRGA